MATGSGGDNVPFWRIVVVCLTKSWRIETPLLMVVDDPKSWVMGHSDILLP